MIWIEGGCRRWSFPVGIMSAPAQPANETPTPKTSRLEEARGATAVAVVFEPFAAYVASDTEGWKKAIDANIKME